LPNCNSWNTSSYIVEGTYGLLHATNSTWSFVDQDCDEPPRCDQARRIYCLEL
jgi:hypothetical protein